MRALLILAGTIADFYEAEGWYRKAESIWQLHRRWHPEGKDTHVDEWMAELRKDLNSIKEILDKEREEQSSSDEESGSDETDESDESDGDEIYYDARSTMEDTDLDLSHEADEGGEGGNVKMAMAIPETNTKEVYHSFSLFQSAYIEY